MYKSNLYTIEDIVIIHPGYQRIFVEFCLSFSKIFCSIQSVKLRYNLSKMSSKLKLLQRSPILLQEIPAKFSWPLYIEHHLVSWFCLILIKAFLVAFGFFCSFEHLQNYKSKYYVVRENSLGQHIFKWILSRKYFWCWLSRKISRFGLYFRVLLSD